MGERDGVSVLHVDDEPGFADMVADFLEREDDRFTVETTTSVEHALEQLTTSNFDCVVSDYDMPQQDGIEFLEAVREQYPDFPFILYTGKGSEEVASDAIAAGATDYLQKGSGTDQYELLANRIQNVVEQFRDNQRRETLERIRTLLRNINRALVRAESRAEAEFHTCEIVSEADPYLFAWIGEIDSATGRIEPRASAGIEDGYLDDITITTDDTPTGRGPGGTAVRERRVAVSQNVHEDPEFAHWREKALERGYQAVAAVPLEYRETLYGVLAVYSERPYAFDEDERALLAELGSDIGHAMHSLELQAELRMERTFIEQALDTLEDVFYLVGTDGTLRRWNDRALAVTGYDEAEVADRPVTEFFPEDERETIADGIETTLRTGDDVVEADLLTADGERIPYEFSGSRCTDTDGDMLGLIGIGRDISDRKERERRLQRQTEKIKALHDVATKIESSEEAESVYELLVGAAESILEFDIAIADETVEEVLVPRAVSSDLSGEQYYHETSIHAEDNFAARVYRTRKSSVVTDLRTHDVAPADPEFRSALTVPIGEYGVFQTVAKSTDAFDENDLELAELLVSHTESALDRLTHEQQLRRQNARLEQFASVVSHDLRNPLTVASGRLELAKQECDAEYLDDVALALDRMNALIDDLLTLAQAGERVDEMASVDLAATTDGCWQTVATAEAILVTEPEQTIRADQNRLKQLLENLIRNAIEHGGDEVTVTIGDLDDHNGFYVADDGPGIPEDEREQVFEAGYSAASEGSGLGLSIVEEIADAHDWSVRVTESNSGGARFEIIGVEVVDE